MPKYLDIDGLRTLWAQITNKISHESNATAEALEGKADLIEGKIPASQLPSYVDDVLEYANKASFPATGESGKIYLDLATNLAYRWGGTAYTEISPSLALGTTSSTAYRGDYGAAAYKHAVTNKGIAKSSGLYKITTNAEGHVTAATAVAKADITGLGIPAQDTTYENATTSTDGLMSSEDKAKLDNLQEDLITIVEKEGSIVSTETISGLSIHPTSYIESTQSGSGDPSPDNVRPISGWDSVSVTGAGKNLVNWAAIGSKTNGGITFTNNGDGTFAVSGETADNAANTDRLTIYLQPGQYKIDSGNDTVLAQIRINRNGTVSNKQNTTFTIYGDETSLMVNLAVAKNKTVSGIVYPLLTMADDAGDYEPYQGQTLTANLPETVYGGVLDWTTGVLTVTHAAVILDGTENIRPNGNSTQHFYAYCIPSDRKAGTSSTDGLCSHYQYGNAYNGLDGTIQARESILWICNSSYGGVDGLKAFLAEQYAAGTPVTVVYELAEPYTIQLTPQQLSTVYGENNIWSNAGQTEVTYAADTKLYIDGKIAAIAAAIV